MKYLLSIVFILTFPSFAQDKRIVICGIVQNADFAAANTIANIEKLSEHFTDYHVIIYENNSRDNTEEFYTDWASKNSHVTFISEMLAPFEMPHSRTERIARARNQVLNEVQKNYSDFDYLLMADLDFTTPWPIDEILKTINSPIEWDAVSANGVVDSYVYADRYAFRNIDYPLGPEVLGNDWWLELPNTQFYLHDEDWLPVYSAFGGLAIYKMSSIGGCYYAGKVTHDLWFYYNKIVKELDPENAQLKKWLIQRNRQYVDIKNIIITFVQNTFWEHPKDNLVKSCCEHIPFHAAMAKKGFDRFYVNPKMIMDYAIFSPLSGDFADHSQVESPVLEQTDHQVPVEFYPD